MQIEDSIFVISSLVGSLDLGLRELPRQVDDGCLLLLDSELDHVPVDVEVSVSKFGQQIESINYLAGSVA